MPDPRQPVEVRSRSVFPRMIGLGDYGMSDTMDVVRQDEITGPAGADVVRLSGDRLLTAERLTRSGVNDGSALHQAAKSVSLP